MRKTFRTITANSLIEFNDKMFDFIKEVGHYIIFNIKYVYKPSENQYIAFIIHQI